MSKASKRQSVVAELPSPRWWEMRGAVWGVGILIVAGIVFSCGAASWASIVYRLLTDGSLLVFWLLGMFGVGAWMVKPFKVEGRLLRYVTAFGLGLGTVSLLILCAGCLGWLNRGVAWGMLSLAACAGIAALYADFRNHPEAFDLGLTSKASSGDWLWLVVAPFVAVVVLAVMVPPGWLWHDEPHGYDVVEYHLQIPREWFEAGRIIPLHHNIFSYFPFNVEMQYLLAMHLRGGPWAGMYLAQMMHGAMMVVAVMAIAAFVGRGNKVAILLAATTPWLTLLAPVAYNEGGLLLFGTLAVGWAIHALRHRELSVGSMVLSGVMGGFACGVKLTAVPMLVVIIPVCWIAAWFIGKEGRGWIRPVAGFCIAAIIAFSPWLIRNYIWTRNPVFPEAMSILGRGHLSVEQVERWKGAYVPSAEHRSLEGRAMAAWEQIGRDWRYGLVVIPAALFAIVRLRAKGMVFPILLLLLWLCFWLFFTHLQGRFFVLAIPVLAMLVARIETPLDRWVATCGLLLQVGLAVISLQQKVAQRIVPFASLLGIDHYPVFEEPLGPIFDGRGRLCLVGDAQAFYYEMPMSRLHYRTVFDVDARGRDVVDAWFDGCLRDQDDAMLIDYAELERFARTYRNIPAPVSAGNGRTIVRFQK
jgi:hypothetical protein